MPLTKLVRNTTWVSVAAYVIVAALSQVDPHNTVAIDAVHVPSPLYARLAGRRCLRRMCSNSIAVHLTRSCCIPKWLNIGKATTGRSKVEQLRFVLNEHGQLGSKFVDRVIELMMQMVIGADFVMGQLMEK